MTDARIRFEGKRLLVLGFGSIAASILPLLQRHIAIEPDRMLIISTDERYADIRETQGIRHEVRRLTPGNYREILGALLEPGDLLLNLTGGISSLDLVRFCLAQGIHYLDTSNERWEHGAADDDADDFAQHWCRLIGERDRLPQDATALVSHGANPGIVSHFAKQAVENMARARGLLPDLPRSRWNWGLMARELGIKAIHISERDTQEPKVAPRRSEFFNTWSVEGMIEESDSNPCFAWGSRERPLRGAEVREEAVSVVGQLPGRARDCMVRSWLPSFGEFFGAVIPHEETFSIAELFTHEAADGDGGDAFGARYQPTVIFAYRPCDAAWEGLHCARRGARTRHKVMIDEIARGVDELGVLLLRRGSKRVYWYGSTLDVDAARDRVDFANATSLQVAAGVIGGLVWLLENPRRGLVSAEHADHRRVLEIARPYLGELRGVEGHWHEAPETWNMRELLVPETHAPN
ncbi:homospermidine synthase [Paralimibaculum aggregatum]|uniref:Homospermidine synthase n=1 Tax=Paralimibaculum aggregatum TaxID=3036245 RepID=A0ABQ6LII6_9RHOB|nr:saccharopine dehydrogenase NADP-binding domain-containing protein [Limibaculum sp. NKW23]GMG83100.1 homospermidine synthase [Limibaculum sp. NKW23]